MMDVATRSKAKIENGEESETIFNDKKNGHSAQQKLETPVLRSRMFGMSVVHTLILPLMVIGLLPQLTLLVWFTNSQCDGSYEKMLSHFEGRSIVMSLVELWTDNSIVNIFTVGVVFGYFVWAIFWMKVLPGKTFTGPMTPAGNVPVYKDNGFLHYIITMIGFFCLTVILKLNGMSPSIVYDRFGELITFMNLFSVVFVLFLYVKGYTAPSSTDSGKTGSGFIFDCYWGMELYPRVFGIDIKVLTNIRFGMTVWPLLVCIYALKSYELHGFVDSNFVAAVLQLVYVTKFFTWEVGYMSTIDIIVDRAGFYICWGCLSFLPSLYPLVSQYLVSHPVRLGPFGTFVILSLGLVSILINYLADLQRQNVRKANGKCLVWGKKPDIIRAKYTMENGEERESLLLASGWWGISRHFHYVPEILLSFFWTVTAGFEHLLPYTYLIFLFILLIHRSFRDERKCSRKYGIFWRKYCEKVKHRIVPYLF